MSEATDTLLKNAEAAIRATHYHQFPGTTATVCLIETVSGYTTIGKSDCASPEDFNAAIGREMARREAFDRLVEAEAYLMKTVRYLKGEHPLPADENGESHAD